MGSDQIPRPDSLQRCEERHRESINLTVAKVRLKRDFSITLIPHKKNRF
jgi:hypothetical protein